MSADWQEYRIEDIALNVPNSMSTGPFGSAISSKFFQNEGVPVIRGGNLSTEVSERMSDYGLVYISREKAQEFQRSIVRPGDLVFTCWGTINQVGLITEELEYSEYIISNKQMKLTPDPEKADSLFLYYLFSSPIKQSEILNNGIGAAVPGFNLGQLKKHIVRLPNITDQRRIANVIGAFDKKIRHNNKINQTLEEMAQAIFKSWFVDFDPVKAKIEAKVDGQDPERAAMCAISGKTDAELDQLPPDQFAQLRTTAALFPDELIESELGFIPKGWGLNKVENVVNRLRPSKRYTKEQVSEYGAIPVLEQGTSIILGYHNEEPGFIASPDKPLFIFGDHTCVCYLSCAPFDISQNVIPLSGKKYPTIWVYYAVRDKQSFQEYRRHWSEFKIKQVIIPNITLCNLFSEIVTILYQKKERAIDENNCLSQLRDTLLPKLLSGEIDLSQVA